MNPLQLVEGAMVAAYRLDRRLGAGGMGEVWSATHSVSTRRVALKFVKSNPSDGPEDEGELRTRFLREARAAVLVRHPNVIDVHDVFEADEHTPVMVMDLLEGESLRDKLDREETLPIERVAEWMLPVVSAVGTAHARGVIHRDLKPDNIFIAHEGVRVLDFGIAKLVGDCAGDLRTISGIMLGTLSYMPLEQALAEEIDARVDVYALGVILYECLSGSLPVDAPNIGLFAQRMFTEEIVPLHRRAPHVPRDVCDLVHRMLVRNRDERLDDLREVMAVLARYTTTRAPAFDGPPARTRTISRACPAPRVRARAHVGSTMPPPDAPVHAVTPRTHSKTLLAIAAAIVFAIVALATRAPDASSSAVPVALLANP